MKVLHINSSDISGGAARAAYRLHRGLRNISVDSWMYVQSKYSDDWTVLSAKNRVGKLVHRVKPYIDLLMLKKYPSRSGAMFSPAAVMDNLISIVQRVDPDIIHLHWLGHGLFKIETLNKFNKPVVWTMHDLWAVTGGCHYPLDCIRYYERCGICPELGSNRDNDLSRKIWERKRKAWKDVNISIACPSIWLADNIKRSPLLENSSINVIPNGLDCEQFKPIDKKTAREILSLPSDKKLILFGAINSITDKRKGYQLLDGALKILGNRRIDADSELVIFGASEPREPGPARFNTRYIGQLNDDYSLAVLYSAVDVFVSPSIQDNLPNTVMESLSCGTPVVAFNIGGMPDMVTHQSTGYLAKPFEESDLANGIAWILEQKANWPEMSSKCRARVMAEYEISKISEKYKDMYEGLV